MGCRRVNLMIAPFGPKGFISRFRLSWQDLTRLRLAAEVFLAI